MTTLDQIKGEACEAKKDSDYFNKGCVPIKIEEGADRLIICPEEWFFAEYKCSKGKLTPAQSRYKEFVEFFGGKYKTDRCNCKTLESIFKDKKSVKKKKQNSK